MASTGAAPAAALPPNPYAVAGTGGGTGSGGPSLAVGRGDTGAVSAAAATATAGQFGSVVSPPGQQMQQQQLMQQQQPVTTTSSCSSNGKMLLTGPAIVSRLLANEGGGATSTSCSCSCSCGKAENGNENTEQAVRINCEWSSGPGCRSLVEDIMATQSPGCGGSGAAALRDAVQIVVGGSSGSGSGSGSGGGDGNENSGGGSDSIGTSSGSSGGNGDSLIRTATDRIAVSVRLVLLLAALFDAVQAAKKAPPLGGGGGGGGSGGSSSNADGGAGAGAGTSADANVNAISAPKLAATELVKACTAVMAALTKSIGSAGSNDGGDGTRDGSGSGSGSETLTWSVPAAQLALESSYRAFHPILADKAQFLQLWRGITDVALASSGVISSSALASSSSSPSPSPSAADANRRYYSALSDATTTLLGYVKEGTDALWMHLSPALLPLTSDPPRSAPPPASESIAILGTDPELPGKVRHLVKMFVFLLARVAHVLSIMVTTSGANGGNGSGSCCSTGVQPLPPPPTVLSSVMNHMARLRGLSVRLEILAERAKGSGEEQTLAMLDKIRKDVLEPIAKIGSKADALVVKNLLPSSSSLSSPSKSKPEAGPAPAIIHRMALNALLGVADQPFRPSGEDDDFDDGSDDEVDGSITPPSLALGKLFMLRALLRKLRPSSSEEGGSTNTVASKEVNVEATLSISEDLLFFTLPLCHATLDSFDFNDSVGPSILLDVVDLIADCTIRNELRVDDTANATATKAVPSLRPQDGPNAPPTVANQMHMLLVRWLVPSRKECANSGDMYLSLHPLSREMAISVVHLHTLRLCAMASDAGRGPLKQYTSSNTEASSRRLISLLCQVLIDPRTVAEGRSNVSAVLLRLLSSSPDYSTTFARNESIGCFIDAVNIRGGNAGESGAQQPRKAGRKRRRKEIKQSHDGLFYLVRHWSAQDIASVGSVLRIVSAQATFWEDASDAVKESIQQLCQNISASKARKRPGSVGLVSFCLAGGLDQGRPLNIDINEVHSKIIQVLSEVSPTGNDGNTDADAAVPAMLLFVENFMKLRKQSYPVNELDTLVKSCSAFVGGSGGGRNVHLTYAVASFLSAIGGSISANCPAPFLKTIASTFQALFQSDEWPLIAATMSSLLDFFQSVHKAQLAAGKEFLPEHLQPLMKSRMQGSVFDLESMSTLDADVLQVAGEDKLNLSRARRRKVYARSDFSLTDNSKAVTITKDGKIGAILIIPQGSDFSMCDLALSGGFVPNQLGTIAHIFPTNDGSGCAMQIQDDNI